MTDIEEKALALLNEVQAERGYAGAIVIDRNCEPRAEALCRAIEQHEAFRQEVSDAVEAFWPTKLPPEQFARFIIAKPVDPLREVVCAAWLRVRYDEDIVEGMTRELRARGVTAPARGDGA